MTKINMSLEELEQALAEKKKEAALVKQQRRLEYEKSRDELVTELVARARVLNTQMKDYKAYCLKAMQDFKLKALEYGDIRANSKGGFSLRNSETGELASLDRNMINEYDERAAIAEDLIKEFLEDKIRKKDMQTYRTIRALVDRNKKGDFKPGQVASMLKIKDNYDDPRWIKAMELFEESYNTREISYSVSFYRKDTMGKDQSIILSFTGIPVEENVPEKEGV